MVTAIQTNYNGYKFRSRLEARWAVVFTELGISYEYEPEGFELPSGRYLPDFYLTDIDAWFEVKGREPSEYERQILAELAQETHSDAFMAIGQIPSHNDDVSLDAYFTNGAGDFDYRFAICGCCNQVGIEYESRAARIHPGPHDKGYTSGIYLDRINNALNTGRSARFEFGDTPR